MFEQIKIITPGKNKSEARQVQVNLSISRNFFIPEFNNLVIAPVPEFSFVRNKLVTGESGSFGFISPRLSNCFFEIFEFV